MADNQLEVALKAAGLTPEEFADIVEVDPKSVYRWLAGGTVPYPRHRRKISLALNRPEHELWPETVKPPEDTEPDESDIEPSSLEPDRPEDRPQGRLPELERPAVTGELAGSWERIGEPGAPHPVVLFSQAVHQIDVFDPVGDSLLTPGIIDCFRDRAGHGCQIRVLTDWPPRTLEPLIGHQHVHLRHSTTPGVVVIRADTTILLPIPLAAPGPPALIQLQRTTDDGIFDRLICHFQTLWNTAKPITSAEQLHDTPGRTRPGQQSAAQAAPRRWPRQQD